MIITIRKAAAAVLTAVLIMGMLAVGFSASAETAQGVVDSYCPLHVAIVMDASGSIKSSNGDSSSDPELVSREAAKTLINCLPSEKNEVALFEYSNIFNRVSDLTSLDTQENVSRLRDQLSGMTECSGDTHMVEAITQAREYLEENHTEGMRDVIVVFTDGAENGVLTPETATADKIRKVVSDAVGHSDVVVYSVAFDYEDETGKHSIMDESGKGGYGKDILDEFAAQTGGQVMITEGSIMGLDANFNAIVEDLCHVKSNAVDEFPGDGGSHTTDVKITDAVVEADMRIVSASLNAVRNGDVRLFDPNGEEVTLEPDGNSSRENVWYSEDKLAANIKIITPEAGTWRVEVKNIVSDEPVKISLIEQYNMSLSTIINSGSDDFSNVSAGEELDVEVKLVSNGRTVTDSYLYEANGVEAYAYVANETKLSVDLSNTKFSDIESVTRQLAEREGAVQVKLESDGSSFKGKVPFDTSGTRLLSIWVNSDRFYCYEDFVINVNGEIVPVGSIPDITVYNGESNTIPDILSYNSSPKSKVELESVDEKIAAAAITDNSLTVTAASPGETTALLRFTSVDESSSFTSPVNIKVLNAPPLYTWLEKDVSLRKGAKLEYAEILEDVKDPENDTLTMSIIRNTDNAVVTADIDDSKQAVILDGLKKGTADIQIAVSDNSAEKNTIIKTIHVKVNGSLAGIIAGCIGAALLGVILVLVIFYLIERKRRVDAVIHDLTVMMDDTNDITQSFPVLSYIDLSMSFKQGSLTFEELMESALYNADKPLPEPVVERINSKKALLSEITIKGALKSGDCNTIICKSKDIGCSEDPFMPHYGLPVKRKIYKRDTDKEVFLFIGGGEDKNRYIIKFTD